jgi:hypothetical protein
MQEGANKFYSLFVIDHSFFLFDFKDSFLYCSGSILLCPSASDTLGCHLGSSLNTATDTCNIRTSVNCYIICRFNVAGERVAWQTRYQPHSCIRMIPKVRPKPEYRRWQIGLHCNYMAALLLANLIITSLEVRICPD